MTLFLLLTNLIGGLIAVQLFRGDVPPSQQEMSFYQILNAFLAMYQVRIKYYLRVLLMRADFFLRKLDSPCVFCRDR